METIGQAMINSTEKTVGCDKKIAKYCEFCGKELEQLYWGVEIKRYVPAYKPCTCEQAKEEAERLRKEELARAKAERQAIAEKRRKERIKELLGSSGMTERALRCSFDGFQLTFDNEAAYKACKNFNDNFSEIKKQKKNGLFLAGPCGVGKSHLAFSIANSLIHQGKDVISMTMIDLLLNIKKSYDSATQNEMKILKVYEDCSLLVIDDLGKEKPTEWTLQMIYTIIDRRYNALKPIIVTTNYTASELIERLTISKDSASAVAIVDRLFEMCEYIPIKGESHRKNKDG